MIQIPYKIKKNIFTLKSQHETKYGSGKKRKKNMGQEEMQLGGQKPH